MIFFSPLTRFLSSHYAVYAKMTESDTLTSILPRRKLGAGADLWILNKHSGAAVIILHWSFTADCSLLLIPFPLDRLTSPHLCGLLRQGELLTNSFNLSVCFGVVLPFPSNTFNLPCIKVCSRSHSAIPGEIMQGTGKSCTLFISHRAR